MKTKKEKEEIARLYRTGVSIENIIDNRPASPTTVWRIAKSSGVKIRAPHRPIVHGKEVQKKVAKMYLEGNTIKNIMYKTGIKSEQTLYKILKKNNIELRRK